jgi:two-component system response regulator DevR
MEQKIKVMLVDDHELVRFGLRSLLSMHEIIEIVGEAANANEAVNLALEKEPHVILMDIRMPGKSGIDACREIKKLLPSTNLIMLTSFDGEEAVHESILAGASGYVLKEIGFNELIQTIKSVAAGKSLLDPITTGKVFQIIKKNAEGNILLELTHQEKHVLSLLAQGMTNREISKVMILSEKTVRNYVSQILSKLNLHNRSEAAVFAVRHHLD